MEATADSEKPSIRVGRRRVTAAVSSCICLCVLSLPGYAASQEPRIDGSSPSAAAADADPLHMAERLLAGFRPAMDDAAYGQTLIETARAVGRMGELETALQLLTQALEHYRSGPLANEHRAMLTARLGISSAAWQLGKHELVIEHASELLRSEADGSDLAQRIAAQQLLVKSLQQVGRLERALEVVGELAQGSAAAKGFAAEHALVIGGAALRSGQLEVAAEAYQFYLASSPQGPRTADAVLGVAWAAAMGAQPPQQAEQQLANFIDSYPQHHDVPHALRARANLLKQLGRDEDAQRIGLEVIDEYPGSEAAFAALEDFVLSSPPPWPKAIRAGWLRRLRRTNDGVADGTRQQNRAESVRPEVLERLLVGGLASGDDTIWQATVEALLRDDADGSQTRLLFESLADTQQVPVAEHLAVDLLSRLIDGQNAKSTADQPAGNRSEPNQGAVRVPAACEAACRWAGLMERWSMLALVTQQLRPATQSPEGGIANPHRLAIDRMLAESLMQTRRSKDALLWWDAIIDVQGANDFATLLRGAEASVAHGSLDNAARRLSHATNAAQDDAFNLSLVRMLEAELAIRKARMDEARDLLSAILRATESAAELRPRAQWLIGETFFLQARYGEAIDAYRRVDALDSEGEWAAAALLQAGKAFEKLLRSREAATCYTALLSRFSDTPHASQARTRLAQLDGNESADAPLRR